MINEINEVLSHDSAADVVCANWRKANMFCRREFVIPNGRRADVIGRTTTGDIYIAEVKDALKDSLIIEALEKYGRYCNYLYIAVAAISEPAVDRWVPITSFPQNWHRVGILGVYPSSIRLLRQPSYRQVGRFDKNDVFATLR